MSLVVQKYGGTSVASIERIKFVAQNVKSTYESDNNVVVVVSAMGKYTNELISLAKQISIDPDIRELDMLLTVGERISMSLLSMALNELSIPTVSLTGSQCGILTDSTHGNARIKKILGDRIKDAIDKKRVAIVAGFQGMCPDTKEITTLGRGGSDLSAMAISNVLNADICEIYTDVEGVGSADPNVVPEARILETISWSLMTDLAWAGAKVIHPRAAHLAEKCQIPYWIKSSFDLDKKGTLIKGMPSMEDVSVKSITQKADLNLLKLEINNDYDLITTGLQWLWDHGESPIITHQNNIDDNNYVLTQTVPSSLVDKYLSYLNEKTKKGSSLKVVSNIPEICCLTIGGENFRQNPNILNTALQLINDKVYLIEPKNSTLTICIDQKIMQSSLQILHKELIDS